MHSECIGDKWVLVCFVPYYVANHITSTDRDLTSTDGAMQAARVRTGRIVR